MRISFSAVMVCEFPFVGSTKSYCDEFYMCELFQQEGTIMYDLRIEPNLVVSTPIINPV